MDSLVLAALIDPSQPSCAPRTWSFSLYIASASAGIVAAIARSAATAAMESRVDETGVMMPLSEVATRGMRRSASGRKRTTQIRPTRSCTPTRSKGKVNP